MKLLFIYEDILDIPGYIEFKEVMHFTDCSYILYCLVKEKCIQRNTFPPWEYIIIYLYLFYSVQWGIVFLLFLFLLLEYILFRNIFVLNSKRIPYIKKNNIHLVLFIRYVLKKIQIKCKQQIFEFNLLWKFRFSEGFSIMFFFLYIIYMCFFLNNIIYKYHKSICGLSIDISKFKE